MTGQRGYRGDLDSDCIVVDASERTFRVAEPSQGGNSHLMRRICVDSPYDDFAGNDLEGLEVDYSEPAQEKRRLRKKMYRGRSCT